MHLISNHPIIYIKESGGLSVPVTARIDWLPDGKILPRFYWTPDGSCYKIKHIYEMTPLAFLKDGGVGLRFRIRAAITETPEPYSGHRFAQHETYLYLASGLFCGKNIIDERYGHEGKKFIPVTLDVFPDCTYELINFTVQETKYTVEKTIAIEPRASFNAGGIGVWHKVKARQTGLDIVRTAALYFEINKWFIRVKTA